MVYVFEENIIHRKYIMLNGNDSMAGLSYIKIWLKIKTLRWKDGDFKYRFRGCGNYTMASLRCKRRYDTGNWVMFSYVWLSVQAYWLICSEWRLNYMVFQSIDYQSTQWRPSTALTQISRHTLSMFLYSIWQDDSWNHWNMIELLISVWTSKTI